MGLKKNENNTYIKFRADIIVYRIRDDSELRRETMEFDSVSELNKGLNWYFDDMSAPEPFLSAGPSKKQIGYTYHSKRYVYEVKIYKLSCCFAEFEDNHVTN